MQGPVIPYRPGRKDGEAAACTPDGRLPDASQREKHLRDIFYRMGFNDQEIVALSGAHALGRCHVDRSGFDGPWTFSPTVLTNDYYKLLLNEKWQWKKWDGPAQVSQLSPPPLHIGALADWAGNANHNKRDGCANDSNPRSTRTRAPSP